MCKKIYYRVCQAVIEWHLIVCQNTHQAYIRNFTHSVFKALYYSKSNIFSANCLSVRNCRETACSQHPRQFFTDISLLVKINHYSSLPAFPDFIWKLSSSKWQLDSLWLLGVHCTIFGMQWLEVYLKQQ